MHPHAAADMLNDTISRECGTLQQMLDALQDKQCYSYLIGVPVSLPQHNMQVALASTKPHSASARVH
jgi:hypothetical protein